jgi:hypothetical protein
MYACEVVELARFDERGDSGRVFRSLVMAREERVLSIEDDRDADAAVVEEADEPSQWFRP